MQYRGVETGVIVTEVDSFGVAINRRESSGEYVIVLTKRAGALVPAPLRKFWEGETFSTKTEVRKAIADAVEKLGAEFVLDS